MCFVVVDCVWWYWDWVLDVLVVVFDLLCEFCFGVGLVGEFGGDVFVGWVDYFGVDGMVGYVVFVFE